MKRNRVLAITVAGLLAASPAVTLADRDDRDDRHRGDRGHRDHEQRWDRHDRRGHDRHFRNHRSGPRWHGPRATRGYYWRGRWHYGPRPVRVYRHGHYYWDWGPAYLGSALVGTAIGYSLAQGQDDCRDCDRYESGSRYEIEGCYRIEMLPDGRERRVELPLSDCR